MVGEPAVHEFFRVLSLCHTVMSEEKSEGKDLEQSLRINYLPYSESHFIQWKSLNKVYLRKLLTLILLEGNDIVIRLFYLIICPFSCCLPYLLSLSFTS